jgi:hypothetical protein
MEAKGDYTQREFWVWMGIVALYIVAANMLLSKTHLSLQTRQAITFGGMWFLNFVGIRIGDLRHGRPAANWKWILGGTLFSIALWFVMRGFPDGLANWVATGDF